jgi:hypothetical protein
MLGVDIEQQVIGAATLIDEPVVTRRLQTGKQFVETEQPGGMDEV